MYLMGGGRRVSIVPGVEASKSRFIRSVAGRVRVWRWRPRVWRPKLRCWSGDFHLSAQCQLF